MTHSTDNSCLKATGVGLFLRAYWPWTLHKSKNIWSLDTHTTIHTTNGKEIMFSLKKKACSANKNIAVISCVTNRTLLCILCWEQVSNELNKTYFWANRPQTNLQILTTLDHPSVHSSKVYQNTWKRLSQCNPKKNGCILNPLKPMVSEGSNLD